MAKKASGSVAGYRTLISDIKKGNIAPVYLLMGEEPYYLDLIVKALEENTIAEEDKDFNSFTFYGADADLDKVRSTARQLPMMSPRIAVYLKEAQAMDKAKTALNKLASYVENPNPQAMLCIVYKGDNLNATSELMKAAVKSDAVVFKSPEVKDYNLPSVVRDYCNARKIGIENGAVEMLCQNIGNPLSKLFGEIDKLIVAIGTDSQRITAEDIEKNIGISKKYNSFELVKAVASRDYPAAMRIVDFFQHDTREKSNNVATIAGTLFRFFSQLTVVLFMPERTDSAMMMELGFKSPYQLTDIRTALRNYNARQAVDAIHAIREFDCQSKGINSFQNSYELLKQLIFKIFTLK